MRIVLLSMLCLVSMSLAGCSKKNNLLSVNGKVTVNGQAVDSGTITFYPADGKGPTAQAAISAGQYQAPVSPGKKSVAVQAFREKKTNEHLMGPDSPLRTIKESLLSEKFDDPATSGLECEISSEKKTQDFDLKTS